MSSRPFGVLSAIGLLLLAGCAKPLEVASITEIKSNTGSRSIDVHEPKRASGQTSVPEFAGDQLLEVRTYTSKPDSGNVEIAGATCSVSAADFSATMTTPAKVRVPLYRAQSSTLAVACELDGYQKRMITLAAVDATREQRLAGGANGGLIGVVAISAIDAFSDNSKKLLALSAGANLARSAAAQGRAYKLSASRRRRPTR